MANRICADCISDSYLQETIRSSPQTSEVCDFCQQQKPTIDLWELASKCDVVIKTFFEVSSRARAVVIFDRPPAGFQVPQLLERVLGGTEELREELVEILGTLWFDRDTMESDYGDDDDPWFVDKTDYPEALSVTWKEMERQLRHEARLVNPAVRDVLDDVFGQIAHYQTRDGRPIIVEVGPGCELHSLFRAREFQTYKELEEALSHPEARLGPPPAGTGVAGRMNCAGVPVFYGAEESLTAVREVRPAVGSHVGVGEFKIIRSLRLLDLNALGSVGPGLGGSLFDPVTQARAGRSQFFGTLTRKLSMPVVPKLSDRDYLTTQAIADFLATHPSLQLDGIIFPSAQRGRDSQGRLCRNVTLFTKASLVVGSEPRKRGTFGVQLFENDEEREYFAPQIHPNLPEQETGYSIMRSPDAERRQSALELNPDTIQIHEVTSIEVGVDTHDVHRHTQSRPGVPTGAR
jgi:hypothetical protein